MKKLSWFNRIIFFFNILFTLLLCTSFLAPFVSVETISFLSIFSLSVPLLVFINLLFCIYWSLQRDKRLFLSAMPLLFGYFIMGSFLQFKFTEEKINNDDLKVMSYNARGFNKYKWLDDDDLGDRIIDFVFQEDPDIICFQEFSRARHDQLKKNYNYSLIIPGPYVNKVNQAIYSRFPIINTGEVPFKDTKNITSYADILYEKDTIRIYNAHLESLKIVPQMDAISSENSTKLYDRITNSFKKQQKQAEIIRKHRSGTSYKTIVCGDFNNNQYSNVYRIVKGDLQDTFDEEGTAYGRTYNFKYYPLRIDFILVDERFKVTAHKNYDMVLSDHFPVMTGLRLRANE